MKIKYSLKDIYGVRKPTEPWYTIFLIKWLVVRVTWLVVNFTRITPNQITILGFLAGLAAGWLFYKEMFLIAPFLYVLSNFADAVDGTVARVRGTKSKFGAYFDNFIGWTGTLPMTIGLTVGFYNHTGKAYWIFLGILINFAFLHRAWEGALVSSLLGDSYKKLVSGPKKGAKSLLQKVQTKLLKHYLREPFNAVDVRVLILVVAPLTPIPQWIILFTLIGFVLNMGFWFFYYTRILKSVDRKG